MRAQRQPVATRNPRGKALAADCPVSRSGGASNRGSRESAGLLSRQAHKTFSQAGSAGADSTGPGRTAQIANSSLTNGFGGRSVLAAKRAAATAEYIIAAR